MIFLFKTLSKVHNNLNSIIMNEIPTNTIDKVKPSDAL